MAKSRRLLLCTGHKKLYCTGSEHSGCQFSCSTRGIHKQLADPSIQLLHPSTCAESRDSEDVGWTARPLLHAGQAPHVPSEGHLTLIAHRIACFIVLSPVPTCAILLKRRTTTFLSTGKVLWPFRLVGTNLFHISPTFFFSPWPFNVEPHVSQICYSFTPQQVFWFGEIAFWN